MSAQACGQDSDGVNHEAYPSSVSLSGEAPTPASTRAPRLVNAVNVPASIDASGGSDVSSALQSFINGVPDGSTIVFRAGGTYSLGRGLRLNGRRNLVFDGQGATLRTTGPGGNVASSTFLIEGGSRDITIRDLSLVGNNPDAGTADAYHGELESLMVVAIYVSCGIWIAHV